jgi:hypothetical protein
MHAHAHTTTTRACTRAATATTTLGIHPTAVPLAHLRRAHVKAIEPTNLGQGAVHRNDADDAVTPSLTIDLLCVLDPRAGMEVTLSSSRTCDQVPIATLPDGISLVSLTHSPARMSMCSGPPLLCNVTRTVSPLCVPLLCNVTRTVSPLCVPLLCNVTCTVSPLCVLVLRYKTLLADLGIIILLKNYFQSIYTNTTCFVFCVSGLYCTRACVRHLGLVWCLLS